MTEINRSVFRNVVCERHAVCYIHLHQRIFMFLGLCMYLCSRGSKRFTFHERRCMVFGSMYVSVFNSNSRLARHGSSFTVFFWDRIIRVSIETKDFMIEVNMTCRMFSSFLPQRWWIHQEGQMHLGQPCLDWEDGWPHLCRDHICAFGYSPASYGLTAPAPFMPP